MDFRYLRILVVVVSIFFATGCDTLITQKVLVNVGDWVGPPESIRFHANIGCAGNYIEVMRSSDKTYAFTTDSIRGGVGVVTQELTLCFLSDGEWRPFWSSRHGGGAKEILIKCDSETSCTDEFIY